MRETESREMTCQPLQLQESKPCNRYLHHDGTTLHVLPVDGVLCQAVIAGLLLAPHAAPPAPSLAPCPAWPMWTTSGKMLYLWIRPGQFGLTLSFHCEMKDGLGWKVGHLSCQDWNQQVSKLLQFSQTFGSINCIWNVTIWLHFTTLYINSPTLT